MDRHVSDRELEAAGFKPGHYCRKCRSCDRFFMGDKRSFRDRPCARAWALAMKPSLRTKEDRLKNFLPGHSGELL